MKASLADFSFCIGKSDQSPEGVTNILGSLKRFVTDKRDSSYGPKKVIPTAVYTQVGMSTTLINAIFHSVF